ncbi:hypothetical protein ABIA32_002401 [Streptacidiphilus sp. MAP12-20]|uniref:DUF1326 domain-containing protein n=1 Tax=Streptacidiphilus sp. MAP12-20 TaxID=3156299 RepID=UPI00351236B9
MAWRIEGTYFENCNCNMVCPCSTSGLSAPADYDRCLVALAFHVASGLVDGLDVSGLTVAVVADAPPLMSEGNWRMGMFMDAAASPEQAEALGAVFSGQLGGPMEGLGPLVGEMLGVEVATIDYVDDGRTHRVRVGDAIAMEVEDFVSPLDATGKGVRVSGVGFPADTLAAGTATASRVNAFGLEWDNEGKNAFSAPFAWSA